VAKSPLVRFSAPGLDLPGDHVDSGSLDPTPVFAQPSSCAGHQARLFTGIDRQFGRSKTSAAASLDFDEDQGAPVSNDEVEFDAPCTDVARDDAVAFGLQVQLGSGLSFGA
jgi:hypothetical protein